MDRIDEIKQMILYNFEIASAWMELHASKIDRMGKFFMKSRHRIYISDMGVLSVFLLNLMQERENKYKEISTEIIEFKNKYQPPVASGDDPSWMLRTENTSMLEVSFGDLSDGFEYVC